jgi:hypothetical protein
MKTITTKMLVTICAIALFIPLVAGSAVILATSNIINITVTPVPPPTYGLTLTINGTSAATYSGIVHPGDKLVLVANSTSVPAGFVSGKTITFFNNAAYPIGTQTTDVNGIASLTWTVPALTTQNNDVYAFRAELT